MSEKIELFLVDVTIIEGRHLAWPNMDSAVHVRIDNQKKCTAIAYSTDHPFFNEFFAFEFSTTFQTLMDKNITLTVIQPGKIWRSKKILGYVTLDMATVWAQQDHQFYHKWAIIAAPINDPIGGPKGYIKVDIHILRKGESPKIPIIDPQETEEIEGNLLLPEGMATERQRANYVIKIYRGENFSKEKYLDVTNAPSLENDAPSSYVEVFFAGLKVPSLLEYPETSKRKATLNPTWNESLILTELFPPLCQRIKIHLCRADSCCDNTLAVRHINLRSISNDGEHGFLPTFGPTFVHFYGKGSSTEGYVGKILMSFSTDLQVNAVGLAKSTHVESIPALSEVNMWKNELVLLYGIIFNANLIGKKYSDKTISFEINFGNSEVQSGSGDNKSFNVTTPLQPITKEKLYWFLNYGQDKPSLYILGNWPDFRKRLYNSNMITKIVDELKLRLDKIEALFLKEETKSSNDQLENLLLEAIDFLLSSCRNYLDITQARTGYSETDLDRERAKLCLREMGEIENAAKEIYNPKMQKHCFMELQDLYERLELLAEEAQDCWPDVYVTMVAGNKRVAFYKCPIKDIVYSIVDEEKGKYCGIIQELFLQASSKQPQPLAVCKLSMFLWVGLQRHKNDCFKAFPGGFKPPSDLPEKELPRYLIAQEKHYFQCRAHIYQGKFLPGSDRSGLSDPFARVVVKSDCRETAVSKATLNPVWDQTLIYREIIVYGTAAHIKANPPLIVMEIFDQDECCKIEFVGRCTFKPVIKFSNEPYAAPNFPPKLCWYKIYKCKEVLGEILAVAEFIETSEKLDVEGLVPSNEIVRIPSDIKPSMVKYRMEVIFWGVRELQKINLLAITKPKVTVECGYVILHSDTIPSVNKSLNFTEFNKQIEVSLPDQEEYAPPICIKLFDCRSFGRYTLAGTHIASLKYFLYHPLTEEERIHNFITKRKSLESFKSKHVTVPMANYESDQKKNSPSLTPNESRCKQWLKKIFSRREKFQSSNKNKGKKSNKSSGTTTTDEEVEAQRPLLRSKKKRTKTSESTSSGKSSDKKAKKKKRSKDKKAKKKICKTSEENTTTTSEKSTKSHSTSRSKRKNKIGKKVKETTTSSEATTPKKACSKIKTKKNKNKSKVKDTTTTSSEERSSKKSRKPKSPKKKKKIKKKKNKSSDGNTTSTSTERESCCKKLLKKVFRSKTQPTETIENDEKEIADKAIAPEDYDWWTKYYDSIKFNSGDERQSQIKKKGFRSKPKHILIKPIDKNKNIFKIYPNELESQPEFENFTDIVQTFQMYKGKRTGDETVDEANITGIFKGLIKIYRWPPENKFNYVTETGMPLSKGIFQNFPSNEHIKFLARIYCVMGINLRPKDASGRSDPYIIVSMGNQTINDKDNYVPKQINPIFGKCFELSGIFPKDHTITISVWDWDLATSNDLIGETKIDIENRFFTRHRAHCGISNQYQKTGFDVWRDQETPTQILAKLCIKNNIDLPEYSENCVKILLQEFYPPEYFKQGNEQSSFDKEALALGALHRWQEVPLVGCYLVPEHVETRSLYNPSKPGIEQGKLQLWIDIFPSTELPPPPKVNIAPRKPIDYELRVIIWNTDDVLLQEDDFFVGEKMSDIYVKGWLIGPEESQCTDVHYRSMTGEGSFNWRFVFRFKYLSSENKLVKTKKESLFSVDETEFKLPCRLSLQIWDNDAISADDFLGMVTLELANLPRGARSAQTCSLASLTPNTPTINLFKTKRTKGWWPFSGRDVLTKKEILAGKVEAELELVTVEEAEKNPVGLARAEPHPLPKPSRPDTSFSWFKNPLKALKFLICNHYRWKIIKFIILVLLLLGIGVALYSFPGYEVKKLLHV